MSDTIELLTPEPGTALAVIPGVGPVTVESVRALTGDVVFAPGNLERIIAALEAQVRAVETDISTEKGRKAIASLARQVASTKTGLDELGKAQTEAIRRQVDAINADRRVIVKRLDALRDEVRAPLTEWEARRDAEIAAHEQALADLGGLAHPSRIGGDRSVSDIEGLIGCLAPFASRDWGDFRMRASKLYADVADSLKGELELAKKREADAAELAKRRAQEAEEARLAAIKAQQEREAKIAAEAAERARQEAEERAERARLAAAREAERERQQAEAQRAAMERQKQDAERAAAHAEEMRQRAEAKAKADAEARERQVEADRIAAAERAEREKAAAIAAEQKRVADAKAAEERETARRAADKAHRTRINGEALKAFVEAGLSVEDGKAAIVAIACGKVPHVSIAY
jgi:hypothetical protein